jgi:hypothetical protein
MVEDTDVIEKALEAAWVAAEAEQAARNHSATYNYEKCVVEAIKPFIAHLTDKQDRRAAYVEIQKLARKSDASRPFGEKWTGFTIVGAVLDSRIAWLTPGFAEARAYNNLYGS